MLGGVESSSRQKPPLMDSTNWSDVMVSQVGTKLLSLPPTGVWWSGGSCRQSLLCIGGRLGGGGLASGLASSVGPLIVAAF